jgi:hypothetical protein
MASGGGVDGKGPTDAEGYNVSRAVADVWRSFEEVVEEDHKRRCGLGWVIQPGYVVFDLDDALDANGDLRKQFRPFVEGVDTYVEKSLSGRGLHVFVKSYVVPEKDKMSYVYSEDGSKLEILAPGWYVRMTGEVYASKPSKVRDYSDAVRQALQKIKQAKGEMPGGDGHMGEPGPGNSLTDDEVLERAASARNGEKFSRLMDGDTSAHAGDDSRADLALCNILRFWTGGDPEQMDRLFRRSGLMREKWDERRGETTYGERTIALSLKTREFYADPSQQEDVVPTGEVPTGLAGRQLIGKAITEGIEPPAMLIDGILYKGMVHAWHGEPGAGKTLLALWAALRVMRDGRPVLYLDEEGSARTVAERMAGMEADPGLLDKFFHYFQSPGVTLSRESVSSMLFTAMEVGPALVVFDSWVDFLALNGLNENDSVDVTRWVLTVAYPLRELGAAILLLDHVNKDGSGKGGRGSSAKLAKLDAGYKLVKNADYDRQGMGKVTLTRDKDRPAALERSLSFAVGGDGTGRIRVVPNAQILYAVDEPTPNERRMLDVLSSGMRHGDWQRASGLARSSFNAGRERLLKMGAVEKRGGRYFPTSMTDMTEAA